MKTIRFHVGGPSFHPTAQQAELVRQWLGSGFDCQICDGVEAFDDISSVDLLVIMGLHWPGMSEPWAGGLIYRLPNETQKQNLRTYVGSGKPILAFHGGIASYSDWPEFAQLLGFSWNWKITTHADVATYQVTLGPDKGALIERVQNFSLTDELYVNIQVQSEMEIQIHAQMTMQGALFPALMSASGGRIPGAGKTIYMANGHDLRAFESPEIAQLWKNSVNWLTQKENS